MEAWNDTIFALSSGAPPSGVSVIRVSGPQTTVILEALAGEIPSPRMASYRTIRTRNGFPIDTGLILFFRGPASFTGEDSAEFQIHATRIEDAPAAIAACDAISARALADLDKLIEYAAPWMVGTENNHAYFHKGRDYQREIQKARGRWAFDLLEHNSAVEQDSVILEVSNLRRLV